jgi:hypothetical protein
MLLAQWNGNSTPDLVLGIKQLNLSLSSLRMSGPLTDFDFPGAVFPVVISAVGVSVSLPSTVLPNGDPIPWLLSGEVSFFIRVDTSRFAAGLASANEGDTDLTASPRLILAMTPSA